MAKTRRRGKSSGRRPGTGFGPFASGFLLACVVAGGVWFYLNHRARAQAGSVRTADGGAAPAMPVPAARPVRVPDAPFGISEDVFEAGARTYAEQCATCHGTPGQDAGQDAGRGLRMQPPATQVWRDGATASLAPGLIFNEVKLGVAQGGVGHAFGKSLSDLQIWQVSLLVKNSDQPLPEPVLHLLGRPAGGR